MLAPFGKEVVEYPDANSPLLLIFNVIWLLLFGWPLVLNHLFWAVILAITIVGIPFAKQHMKLIVNYFVVVALWPRSALRKWVNLDCGFIEGYGQTGY